MSTSPTSPPLSHTSPHEKDLNKSLTNTPSRLFYSLDEDEDTSSVPSVAELITHVTQLQNVICKLNEKEESKGRICSSMLDSYERRRSSEIMVTSPLMPNTGRRATGGTSSFRRPPYSASPPSTRIAALTKENISLLRTFQLPRGRQYEGSQCGSQKSRSSARTDGGAVFSRLYQPDFYKNRETKLRVLRDRQDNIALLSIPRSNHRSSVCSRDSFALSDASDISTRLYNPDYQRNRNAKLEKLREEREMKNCTFKPSINSNSRRLQKTSRRKDVLK